MAAVLPSFPDVGVDHLMVVKTINGTEGLKTSAIGTCFGVSVLGRDKENVAVLGLAHTSFTWSIEWVFEQLIGAIDREGNVLEHPVFEVAGGMLELNGEEEDVRRKEAVKSLAKTYHIAKMTFNNVESEERPVTMTITANGVTLKTEEVEGDEEAGIDFGDLDEAEVESSDEVESNEDTESRDSDLPSAKGKKAT